MSSLVAPLENALFRQASRRRAYTFVLLIIFVFAMVAGFSSVESRNSGDFAVGFEKFLDWPAEVVAEAWEKRDLLLGHALHAVPALIETLNVAAVATLLSAATAAIMAFAATRGLSFFPPIIGVTRRMMDVMRALPEVVIALALAFILGAGPVPAMIAIAFHTTGALGKLFSEVNENVDMKPVEGLAACGASWFQRIRFGVLPQVAPNWLSYFFLRFEINVRASAILGFVGASGIGAYLSEVISWGKGRNDEVLAVFLLLFLTIVVIDQLSSWIRARLTSGGRA